MPVLVNENNGVFRGVYPVLGVILVFSRIVEIRGVSVRNIPIPGGGITPHYLGRDSAKTRANSLAVAAAFPVSSDLLAAASSWRAYRVGFPA